MSLSDTSFTSVIFTGKAGGAKALLEQITKTEGTDSNKYTKFLHHG